MTDTKTIKTICQRVAQSTNRRCLRCTGGPTLEYCWQHTAPQHPLAPVRNRRAGKQRIKNAAVPDCIHKAIRPLIIQDVVGGGAQGIIYAVCADPEDDACNGFIIKITNKPDSEEGEFAQEASQLGVGPVVIESGNCGGNSYFISQRLLGPTLTQTYPYTNVDLGKILDLYYLLLTKGKIAQRDLKADNIIFDDEKRSRVFIIDYGIAKSIDYDTKQIRQHMEQQGRLLVNSMTTKDHELSVDSKWSDETDRKFATAVLVTVVDQVNRWLSAKFGAESVVKFSWNASQIDPTLPSWQILQAKYDR